MTVRFLKDIPFKSTINNYYTHKIKNQTLPQYEEFINFVANNNIQDICHSHTTAPYTMIALIINNNYCSLNKLLNLIIHNSKYAQKYLYLAINKFYIYSDSDHTNFCVSEEDYDIKLVKYCHSAIDNQFNLVKYNTNQFDDGTLGNFQYPLTTLFFEKIHE